MVMNEETTNQDEQRKAPQGQQTDNGSEKKENSKGKQDGKEQEKQDSRSEDEDDGDEEDGDGEDGDGEDGDKEDGGKEDGGTEKKPVDKRRIALFGGLAAIIIIAVCVVWLLYSSTYEDTDDAQINGHLNTIAARIDGTVKAVYVEDNHPVQAGQTLVELDPSDYQVSYEQAHAQLEQAQASAQAAHPDLATTKVANQTDIASDEASVASAHASVVSAEHDVTTAQAKLEEALATNARAQKDVERYKLLVENDEVSRQQYDQYVATAKAQQATVAADEASVSSSAAIVTQRRGMEAEQRARLQQAIKDGPNQIAIKVADLGNRNAGVVMAQATLQKDQLNLNYTHIVSPVGGIALLRSAEIGDRVTPGQRLLEVVQLGDLWVDANFKETQLRKLRVGQRVTIRVDSLKEDFNGTVEAMPAATGDRASLFPAENATGNFVKVVQRLPVRIRFQPNQRDLDRLRPGMSVEPKVHLD